VVRSLVGGDLPPATGHVVETPGVGLFGLDLERRLKAFGAGAVLFLVLLRKSWIGGSRAGRVFPLSVGRKADILAGFLERSSQNLVMSAKVGFCTGSCGSFTVLG